MKLISLVMALAGCAALAGCSANTSPDAHEGTNTADETSAKTVSLGASDGTSVSIRYAVGERQSSSDHHFFATDVVVRVDKDAWTVGGAGATHAIRVVLMSLCTPSGGAAEMTAYNRQFDVSYTALQSGSGFGYEIQLATQGQEANEIPMSMTSIAGANQCRQELAVVVDGAWLEDPISRTHNFRFNF